MKKNGFLNLVFVILSSCLFCIHAQSQQKTPYDLKPRDVSKMLEQQKKKIEADSDMDPAEKKKLLRLLNQAGGKKINAATGAAGSSSGPVSNKVRQVGITQKVMTDADVENWVHEMMKKLEPQMPVIEKDFVQRAIDKSGGNSVALSNMAVAAWYTGHPKAALMAALKAAALPHPDAALNNVAAILNLSGYEEKAVPVLQNLLSKYPGNSTVLNNLGQAFYGLGDHQKAKAFLLQCIKKTPNHPEACNTIALMFMSAGRSQEAVDYLERSLKGAYNASARNTLEELHPHYNFIPFEQEHFGRPADLPGLDIQMPALPYDVYTVDEVRHKHEVFKAKIVAICNELENKMNAETAKAPAQLMAQEKAGISAPFTEPGIELFGHYMGDYEKTMHERRLKESNVQADIRAKYEPMVNAILKDNSGNYCKKLNEVRSRKQNEISSQYKQYMEENLEIAVQYLQNCLKVLPLISVCPAGYNGEYYAMVKKYLWQYYELSHDASFEVNCEGTGNIKPYNYNPDVNINPVCGYKVVIPIIIGSMKFDCSTFEFEGGELLKLGVKRDFITNQTTLAVGVGLGIETPITELGAQESIYISFDSDQQPTDVGMKGEVKSSVGAGITSETGIEYTMAMNSGIDVSVTQGARSFKL